MSKFIFKTNQEIELIKQSCLLLSKTHGEVAKFVKEGVSTLLLDKIAKEYILDNGGVPSFLDFNGFPYTLCVSINDQVVHGFPSSYQLRDGDIVSIDCGVVYNGYFSDSAYTYPIGEIKPEIKILLDVTKQCLELAIEKAVVGNRIGDIGFAVQNHAEKAGFGVVRELVGHGVGTKVHEKPEVPNYGKRGSGIRLEEGMVLAIEPMINLGKPAVMFWDDGWTVSTRDKSPSAHYEHTVSIRKGKADVLTSFMHIEEVLNKK
ncbi:MAG: type I methionyl aminopeptidase [Sphingobacteriales bacterium]|nr:MAG: type I methionyl aminopeptidase [Sphingobacteriales bacterium]TAF79210.1 MAG: type I methionyl aminopeptidase [Sphingobacteriales bacterium]